MRANEENVIKIHERLFKDIKRHIDKTSFESVSAFIHHVMADIASTGEFSLGGDIPKSEADLVRRRLEALGYLETEEDGILVPVHGGLEEPVNLLVPPGRIEEFIREAKTLDAYHISRNDLPILYRFGDGLLSPLEGPMKKEEYDRVLNEEVLLRDGIRYAWTIPLAFRVSSEQAGALREGTRLAIIDDKNDIVGIITVHDVFPWEKEKYLKSIYGTDRTDHPGANLVLKDRRDWMMGGRVEVLPQRPNPLLSEFLMPAWKSREFARNRRWEKVVAFHTDGYLKRAEEYGMVFGAEKLTREGHFTGVVLSPFVHAENADSVPVETRMKCYRALWEKRLLGKGDKDMNLWQGVGYDLNDQVILLGLDMKRFHAGPKEAVMHAIYRQNLGFTHLIVPPDFAGAALDDGTALFEESAAMEKFRQLDGELDIEPIVSGRAAYFKELGRVGLVEEHRSQGWKPLTISDRELREMMEKGEMPDPRLVRPEVARILKGEIDLYRTSKATNITWHHASINKEDREALNNHRGIVIWYTGLSASGKSSVAHAVENRLYERGVRTYVLDGDNVRHGLNANLGFSPEDREENIRRIGHVAKLFADAGVVVMTAFISPYRQDRDNVRSLLDPGDFIEVFVDCPVDVCEKRDPKGLYKKARAGQIPEFTGISAPYEPPEKPELRLDAGALSIEACGDEVVKYLEENNLISRR